MLDRLIVEGKHPLTSKSNQVYEEDRAEDSFLRN